MKMATRFPMAAGLVLLVSLLAACAAPQRVERLVVTQPPDRIDSGKRYLFYLHNRIVETQGRSAKTPWGEYRYDDILGALADRGFVVISEARPATTQIGPYAAKVASQVNQLLAAGVPPGNITVMGFSKGGAIAVLATAAVANPRVNFVVLAGCLKPGGTRNPADLSGAGRPPQGRVFSIFEQGDTEADSCAANFQGKPGVVFQESVLQGDRGHGAFLAPEPRWVDPALQWARGR